MRSGEVSEPKRHAVLELNQPSMRLVHPDTALFPPNSDPAGDNNTVARVAPLVRDELPLPELLINLLHPPMQSLSPLKRLGLEAAEDLEIGVQLFRRKVPIASVPAFEPGLNQLTFSCDIAYSDSPAASRASVLSGRATSGLVRGRWLCLFRESPPLSAGPGELLGLHPC